MKQDITVQFNYKKRPIRLCSCELEGTYELQNYEAIMRMCRKKEHLFLTCLKVGTGNGSYPVVSDEDGIPTVSYEDTLETNRNMDSTKTETGTYSTTCREIQESFFLKGKDTCRIDVETEAGVRLGFLPVRYTEILANLISAGKFLYAEVLEADPTLAWMRVDVYLLDER